MQESLTEASEQGPSTYDVIAALLEQLDTDLGTPERVSVMRATDKQFMVQVVPVGGGEYQPYMVIFE